MDGSSPSQPENHSLLTRIISDPYIYVLALAPLYLLFVSSNWIFSATLSIDPWVYHGYFRNLQEYKTVFFQDTYYGSRLSWILPGYAIYKFLPPMAANYALHLGLWYSATFALYYTLKTTASRQVGLIAAVFLGSYSYFLQPVGSDYVDGPANVYLLVCFAFLTAAARNQRNTIKLILAGAAFAAVIHTNLFTVIFAPVVMLYFALLSHRAVGRRTIAVGLASLGWFLVGSALLTALLGCANMLIEGNFQFYQPSIHFVRVTIGKPNPWKLPVAQWIVQAWWLVLPVVVAVSALLALANRRFLTSLVGAPAASALLLACVLMILCEWRGVPVLQYYYYASYLIPTTFLAIGALLANPAERLTGIPVIPVALGVLLANSAPLWGYDAIVDQIQGGIRPSLLLLFGALFALCAVSQAGIARWGMVPALIGCHLICASPHHSFKDRHASGDSFVRISRAADTVDAVRQGEAIRFWYRRTDPSFAEFNALNAMYLWGFTMISNNFPEIIPSAMYGPGSLVVIPSSEGDLLAEANKALKEKGLAAEFLKCREVNDGHAGYSLSFARVVVNYSQLHPQALQPCVVRDCQNLVGASAPGKLPLEGWIACERPGPQSSVERLADGIHITTAATRFNCAARYGPLVAGASGRYMFRLSYAIPSGGITFGALSTYESKWLGQAVIPPSPRADRTAVLSLEAEAGESFWLMIVNNHPLGNHASAYVVRELEAYLLPAREAGTRAQSASP